MNNRNHLCHNFAYQSLQKDRKMSIDLTKWNFHYQQYQSGNKDSFKDLLQLESIYLYDYGVRMTGNLETTSVSVNKIISHFENCPASWKTPNDLRVQLYKSYREINLKIWDKELIEIRNPLLTKQLEDKKTPPQIIRKIKAGFI